MYRAKAFFYVAAGVVLVAFSSHLGGRSASGRQVGTGSFDYDADPCALDAIGRLWILSKASHQTLGPIPLPGSGQVLQVSANWQGGHAPRNATYYASVLYTSGDAYYHDVNATGWVYLGNI